MFGFSLSWASLMEQNPMKMFLAAKDAMLRSYDTASWPQNWHEFG
jgi:hypothetical protein